jgi:hypothetical protein
VDFNKLFKKFNIGIENAPQTLGLFLNFELSFNAFS